MCTLRPTPVLPLLGSRRPHNLGPACLQSQSEFYTVMLTQLIFTGLGIYIYIFKKTFFQGEKHAGAIISWEEERRVECVNHQPQ